MRREQRPEGSHKSLRGRESEAYRIFKSLKMPSFRFFLNDMAMSNKVCELESFGTTHILTPDFSSRTFKLCILNNQQQSLIILHPFRILYLRNFLTPTTTINRSPCGCF